jgi:lipid-binding SYLF domain-containing protein
MAKHALLSVVAAVAIATIGLTAPRSALAAAAGVDEDANAALKALYASEPAAKMLSEKAKAILVFPNIVKAGFMVGAQYGEGVLTTRWRDRTAIRPGCRGSATPSS